MTTRFQLRPSSVPLHRRIDLVFLGIAICWTALVLLVNGLPGAQLAPVTRFHIEHLDKAVHFSFYCFMAVFYWNALVPANGARPIVRRPALWAFAIAALVAILDELHQIPVPGRSCDPIDLLADWSGAFAVVVMAIFIKGERQKDE